MSGCRQRSTRSCRIRAALALGDIDALGIEFVAVTYAELSGDAFNDRLA
jgi:hypothetical protein